MKKQKQYRYIGRNGIITSKVLLDGINHIPMYRLEAEPGCVLTNDEQYGYVVVVEDSEVSQWYEIADKTK